MKMQIQFLIRSLFYPTFIFIIFATPFDISAQCEQGGFYQDNPRFTPTLEGAAAYLEELKLHFSNKSLDNPEDMTSQRGEVGTWESFIRLPKKTREIYESVLFPYLSNLITTDNYPQVRLFALNAIMDFNTIPKNKRYRSYVPALDDSNDRIRISAASIITTYWKKDSLPKNEKAEKILWDAASGIDRNGWNVSGLISKDSYEKDPGIIDSVKDNLQLSAAYQLKKFGVNSLDFLDSLKKHGKTESMRNNARRVAGKYR
jgi:hypothetical protein